MAFQFGPQILLMPVTGLAADVKAGTMAGKTTKMAAAKMPGSEMTATETVATTAGTARERACRGQKRHTGQNQTEN
jgi:hypothetical protein